MKGFEQLREIAISAESGFRLQAWIKSMFKTSAWHAAKRKSQQFQAIRYPEAKRKEFRPFKKRLMILHTLLRLA